MSDERYERARKRVQAVKGFYIHLAVYVIVNAGLVAINLLTSPHELWFYWPLAGWGIGLAINGFVVFMEGPFGADWEDRKIRQYMERDAARTEVDGPRKAGDEIYPESGA